MSPARGSVMISAAVLALGVLGGCQQTTAGRPTQVDVTTVGGFEITHFASGLVPGAPAPGVAVDNATARLPDRLATATIADLTEFWGETMPAEFGVDFEPVRRLISYDSRTGSVHTACGALNQANAFYCERADLVAWDRGALLPGMIGKYGPVSAVTVLAHEYGHAVQHRLGAAAGIDETTPSIVRELQADCFAGSYFRWVVAGNSDYLRVSTAEGLNAALSSLYFVRDAPGVLSAEQGAHGTSFDRTYAFQDGFERGPGVCAGYDEALIDGRTTQQEFSEQDTGRGDLPVTPENVRLVAESLRAAFGGARPGTSGGCGHAGRAAVYCPGERAVALNLAELRRIAGPRGDFAAWAAIASRYALSVQQAQGLPLDGPLTGLRTACLVGSWAGAANQPRPAGTVIRLSPGDVDEAVLDMLRPDGLIAADVDGTPVPSGFLRIEAFRVGYTDGPEGCREYG